MGHSGAHVGCRGAALRTSESGLIDPAYTISSNQNLNYNDDFGMRVCGLGGG